MWWCGIGSECVYVVWKGEHSGERRRGKNARESHLDTAGCARVGPPGSGMYGSSSRELIGSSSFSTLPESCLQQRLIRTKKEKSGLVCVSLLILYRRLLSKIRSQQNRFFFLLPKSAFFSRSEFVSHSTWKGRRWPSNTCNPNRLRSADAAQHHLAPARFFIRRIFCFPSFF